MSTDIKVLKQQENNEVSSFHYHSPYKKALFKEKSYTVEFRK